jgi:hypothetical protein
MRSLSRALVVIGVLTAVLSSAGGSPAAAAERKELKLNGNRMSRAVFCHRQSVLIDGNANHVQVRGHCSRVHINGNDNAVVLHAVVPVVSVNGNHNQVYFSVSRNPFPPRIHDNENDNVITGMP